MENKKTKAIALDCGVTVHVNPDCLDNIELLDAVVEGDEGDIRAVSKILRILLPEAEKKELYKALRKDGVATTKQAVDVVAELFTKLAEKEEAVKN